MTRVGGRWTGRSLVVGLVVAVAAAMLPTPAGADHSWVNSSGIPYHWGRATDTTVVAIPVIDSMTHDWDGHLTLAESDWSTWSADIELLDGGADDAQGTRKRCAAVSGKVRACNAEYGRTGWLGLAQIWTSGGHIVQGTAKMNDTYFATAPYNDPNTGWKQFVVCQEVGHDFGLGHVNETFDDPNKGSCMDYTNNPLRDDGAGDNLNPNAHDAYQLDEVIYTHGGEKNTFTAAAAQTAGLSGVEIPDPVGSEQGGVSVFVTDLGGGNQIVQFVIWADANLMAAAHAAPQAPFEEVATDEEGISPDGGALDSHGEPTEATVGGFAVGATVVTVDAVNLRTAASRQAEVVTELAAGTALTVTGTAEEGQGLVWVPVATTDGTLAGYVAADFLALA